MSLESPQDRKSFLHGLIQEEFRSILENSNYELPENTEAIMILSASPRGWHTASNTQEDHPEDEARIKFGVEVYKRFLSKKLNKSIAEITDSDFRDGALPIFILNGATEQLQMMERIALRYGIPKEKIILLNCGDHVVANTKTQFTKLAEHPVAGRFTNIAVVSANYHIPRVARTASTNLPQDVNFDVLGVPFKDMPFNVYRKVRGEVKKIFEYYKKGDIAKYPRGQK